jgi:hypothetical protein
VIFLLVVFATLVVVAWMLHPVLAVVVAFIGYGVIDGVLTK